MNTKLFIFLICLQAVFFGCGADDTSITEPDADKVITPTIAELEAERDAQKNQRVRELWEMYNALEKVTPNTGIRILREIGSLYYGAHPLREEWVKIYQAMLWDNETDIQDLNRLLEIEIQMLTDINPSKHAKLIEHKKNALNHTKAQTFVLKFFFADNLKKKTFPVKWRIWRR
ncbi:MAG: hypothetical protein OXC79_05525 [Candidatus Poribacteria bacterium]|nr:hypothetical protein [Candidatus Poribacteria bacterium]